MEATIIIPTYHMPSAFSPKALLNKLPNFSFTQFKWKVKRSFKTINKRRRGKKWEEFKKSNFFDSIWKSGGQIDNH